MIAPVSCAVAARPGEALAGWPCSCRRLCEGHVWLHAIPGIPDPISQEHQQRVCKNNNECSHLVELFWSVLLLVCTARFANSCSKTFCDKPMSGARFFVEAEASVKRVKADGISTIAKCAPCDS